MGFWALLRLSDEGGKLAPHPSAGGFKFSGILENVWDVQTLPLGFLIEEALVEVKW